MSFHNRTVVNCSRKFHMCSGCYIWIPVGGQYECNVGTNQDGDFYAVKLCPECVEHLDSCQTCHELSADGWYEGDLGDWREECIRHEGENQ